MSITIPKDQLKSIVLGGISTPLNWMEDYYSKKYDDILKLIPNHCNYPMTYVLRMQIMLLQLSHTSTLPLADYTITDSFNKYVSERESKSESNLKGVGSGFSKAQSKDAAQSSAGAQQNSDGYAVTNTTSDSKTTTKSVSNSFDRSVGDASSKNTTDQASSQYSDSSHQENSYANSADVGKAISGSGQFAGFPVNTFSSLEGINNLSLSGLVGFSDADVNAIIPDQIDLSLFTIPMGWLESLVTGVFNLVDSGISLIDGSWTKYISWKTEGYNPILPPRMLAAYAQRCENNMQIPSTIMDDSGNIQDIVLNPPALSQLFSGSISTSRSVTMTLPLVLITLTVSLSESENVSSDPGWALSMSVSRSKSESNRRASGFTNSKTDSNYISESVSKNLNNVQSKSDGEGLLESHTVMGTQNEKKSAGYSDSKKNMYGLSDSVGEDEYIERGKNRLDSFKKSVQEAWQKALSKQQSEIGKAIHAEIQEKQKTLEQLRKQESANMFVKLKNVRVII